MASQIIDPHLHLSTEGFESGTTFEQLWAQSFTNVPVQALYERMKRIAGDVTLDLDIRIRPSDKRGNAFIFYATTWFS